MHNTDLSQTAIVALIVLGAAAYLGRTVWRAVSSARRAKAGDCATGCGCAATPRPERAREAAPR